MNRQQFIQTLIIAPIAGFFGVKAMAKKKEPILTDRVIYHKGPQKEQIVMDRPNETLIINRQYETRMVIHCYLGADIGANQVTSVYEGKTLLHRQAGVDYQPIELILKPKTEYSVNVNNSVPCMAIVDLYHGEL